MCGIAGIYDPSLDATELDAVLRQMTDVITHRGPDDAGQVAHGSLGIGMRRLSIIDVAGGQQPIANESADIHVVCNGEIYNFRALRRSLLERGHRFTTNSDAEVIVHLYEDHGLDAISKLRGMFGLAIWDQRRERLVLGRDRVGKKPLFYAHRNGQFWFGSEMKSLLAANDTLRAPAYRTLAELFQFGFITQPNTIYEHIHRLPAGHIGVLEKGQFSTQAYWDFTFDPDESVSEEDWMQRLDATLADCVDARLESEVPLGIFLSGGLDSSAIVAYAHRAGLNPLKTFTIGFDREEWDESDDAARVATHFGTDHHLLRIQERDLRESLPDTLDAIVRHCDEPFGDASALPTFHVSQLARRHVTVILSGDGGDELFAGYTGYRGAVFAEKYRRRVPGFLGSQVLPTLSRWAASVLPGRAHYRALRVAKVLKDSSKPPLRSFRDKSSIWNDHALRELFQPEAARQMDYLGEQYLPDPLWDVMHADRDLVSRLTEIDIRSYLLDDILVKVDRMSMAHSLEVRSPLLDHHMVELAATMPTRFKIRNGRGKALFRQVLHQHLPPGTMRKPKQGFSVPLRDWFRGELRELVHDTLGGGGLPAEIFSMATVQRVLDEHHRGRADHANKIWLLLMFARWHALYQRPRG